MTINNMLKILHVTDIHFKQNIFNEIIAYQEKVDIICLTGDFIDQSVNAKLAIDDQIEWIKAWLHHITKPIFLCSGNHDVIAEDLNEISLESLFYDHEYVEDLAPYNSLKWLSDMTQENVFTDGSIKNIKGITFGCMPYEYEHFEKFKACDVLLTHVPPAGTKVALGNLGDYGCNLLTTALNNNTISPQIILCGHVHNPQENKVKLKNTKIYNPGFKGSLKTINVITMNEFF